MTGVLGKGDADGFRTVEALAALRTLLKCVHLSGQDELCVLGVF